MRRPLPIAMMLSVTIHAGALAIAVWMIGDTASSTASVHVLVDLRESEEPAKTSVDTAPGDHSVNSAPRGEPANPEPPREAIEPVEPGAHSSNPKQQLAAAENLAQPDPIADVAAGDAQADSSTDTAASRETTHPEPLATVIEPIEPGGDSTGPNQEIAAARILARPEPILAVAVEEAQADSPALLTPSSKNEPTAKQVAVTLEQEREVTLEQERTLTQKLEELTDTALQSSQQESHLIWEHEGQEYLVSLKQAEILDETAIPRLVVQISTTEGDSRLTTEVHLKKLAFSNYAQFVNRWDPNVYLRDDMFDGRFHSNSGINLTYDTNVSPQFFGKVTTSARTIDIDSGSLRADRSEVFLGGLETGVRSIRWPKEAFQMPDEERLAEDRMHRFDANTRITFNSDGTFSWEVLQAGSAEPHTGILKDTSYLIAEDKAVLHVRGTVQGQVLVYSPRGIVIEGDLTYARDPIRFSDSDDFLGLVSGKDIEIAPAEVTGPGDLEINAAIYARQNLTVRDHHSNANASLLIVGSLTAGSMSATEPRYSTRIRFDKRLEDRRPPGFPMTNRYIVEFWNSGWQQEPVEALN